MADEITGLGYETDASSFNTLETQLIALRHAEARHDTQIVPLRELNAAGGYIKRTAGVGVKEFPLDKTALKAVGSFLDIPVPYLLRIGSSLAEENINWHLTQNSDVEVEIVSTDGEITEVRSPDSLAVTPLEVTEILAKIMGADTLVNRVSYGLNGTTYELTNPLVQRNPARRVGDITYGGLRIVLPKAGRLNHAPEVGTYLNRLICTNGAFTVVSGDIIVVSGLTHEDVLNRFEAVSSDVWNRLPRMLEAYVSLDDRPIEDPMRMVQVYALENNIADKYTTRAQAFVSDALIETPSREWTLYDIMQVFTSLAHLDGVKDGARDKLMALGGRMVAKSDEERRCGTCSHLLSVA